MDPVGDGRKRSLGGDPETGQPPDARARSAIGEPAGRGRAAIPALCEQLAKGQPTEQAAAARALGRLRDLRAVAPLLHAPSGSAGAPLREACIEALARIGAPAVPLLARALAFDAEEVASSALVRIGSPAAGALLDALYSSDRAVRTSAVRILAAIGTEEAGAVLARVLGDPERKRRIDVATRIDLALALGTVIPGSGSQALTQVMRDADEHPLVRACAAIALCERGDSEAERIQLAVGGLHGNHRIRKRAAAVLACCARERPWRELDLAVPLVRRLARSRELPQAETAAYRETLVLVETALERMATLPVPAGVSTELRSLPQPAEAPFAAAGLPRPAITSAAHPAEADPHGDL
ncbi:MAG: HEAT repeat domain-containing protein [Armatimonadota bacterium]